MQAKQLPVFHEDPDFTPPGGFLSEEAYLEARKCLPFIGTDAIIVDLAQKLFFLPKRKATPAAGYWPIGGGLKTGKQPQEAMAKAFVRETKLEIEVSRLIARADLMNLAMWKAEPIENLHLPFFVELTPEERELVAQNLDQNEYADDGLKSFDREGLIDAHKAGDISDGAIDVLLYYYDGIFA